MLLLALFQARCFSYLSIYWLDSSVIEWTNYISKNNESSQPSAASPATCRTLHFESQTIELATSRHETLTGELEQILQAKPIVRRCIPEWTLVYRPGLIEWKVVVNAGKDHQPSIHGHERNGFWLRWNSHVDGSIVTFVTWNIADYCEEI